MAATMKIQFDCGWVFNAPVSPGRSKEPLHKRPIADTVSKLAEDAHKRAHPNCKG